MLRVLRPCAAVILLALPSAAFGDDGQATVDPNSPAGAQYAIPIQTARDQAGDNKKDGSDASLFGAGVQKDTTTTEAAPAAAAPSSDGTKAKPAAKPAAAPAAGATAQAPAALALDNGKLASDSTSSGGSSGMLALLGGAAVVLLLGSAIGVFLRRRTS